MPSVQAEVSADKAAEDLARRVGGTEMTHRGRRLLVVCSFRHCRQLERISLGSAQQNNTSWPKRDVPFGGLPTPPRARAALMTSQRAIGRLLRNSRC